MPMDKITDQLYIGSWQDAAPHRKHLILQNKITAVVNLAIDHDDKWAAFPHAFYFKVGLIDGGGNPSHYLDAAVNLVSHLLTHGDTVLVHCISGISRSAYVSTRVLATQNKPYQETYNMIMAKRPRTVGMSPFFKELLGVN
jgi:protein-tyrosine phosphatase